MKRLIYDVPKWHVYLHRSGREVPIAAKDSTARPWLFQDELFERLYTGEPTPIPDGEIEDSKNVEWAKWAHKLCDDVPDFQRLAEEVRGDSTAAALAAESIWVSMGSKLSDEEKEKKHHFEARNALRAGAQRAVEKVQEAREAACGLEHIAMPEGEGQGSIINGGYGAGSERGEHQAGSVENNPARRLAKLLQNDNRLKRISLLAGRFKRIAEEKQRQKSDHARDEITNICQGDEIGRLLPSELMKLRYPALRLLLLKDLTERRALQYELSGTEQLGKGPIVMCLDKSGSMHGDKDIWASAVALALLGIAKKQNRIFALIDYDSDIMLETICKPTDDLPLSALLIHPSGGTNTTKALKKATKIVRENPGELKRADIILVSDGVSDTSNAYAFRKKAQDAGANVFGIGIGVPASSLNPWCHNTYDVYSMTSMGNAMAEGIFTI